MKKKRKNKVEIERRKNLLEPILDKWVCFKQVIDNEEKYIFMKHKLKKGSNTFTKIEQIVLSDDPSECGVYYFTDFDIDKVLDHTKGEELIEITPINFDQIIGIFSEKERVNTLEELKQKLVEKEYLTEDDINKYATPSKEKPLVDEIILGL